MSSTPPIALLSPLIEALLTPDHLLNLALSLSDTPADMLLRLKDRRAELLGQLHASPITQDAFKNSAEDQQIVLDKLCDAVFAAASTSQSSASLSGWFGVFQKVSARTGGSSYQPLVELAMYRTVAEIGEQRYLRLLDAHDDIKDTLRAYQLQNRLSGQTDVLAKRIADEVLAACGGPDGAMGQLYWPALEDCMASFLAKWAAQPATAVFNASISFLTGFLRGVVAPLQLSQAVLELLLLRMDLELSKLSSAAGHSFISDVIAPLLAGSGRLGVVGDLIQRAQSMQNGNAQIAELFALQAVMSFSPNCPLAMQWSQKLNISVLRKAGLQAKMVEVFAKNLIDAMRPQWERHALDVIGNAAVLISVWAQAADAAEIVAEHTRHTTDSIASQLIEGAADTQAQTRIASQLQAMVRVCIQAWALGSEPIKARALVRRAIAMHLNTTRDLYVWKRHREISARLAQIELPQAMAAQTAALEALAPEIERALSDQARVPASWLGTFAGSPTKQAQASVNSSCSANGLRAEELQFLTARYAMLRRLHGEAGVLGAMNRWYCGYLFGFSAPVDWKAVAHALSEVLGGVRPVAGAEELFAGLKVWIDQLPRCAAARNLGFSLDRIADSTITYGGVRYAQRVRQGLAPEPPGGVVKAWALGRIDCAWTLGRLSYVVCSGEQNISDQLWFWWQIGVGKNISRVPEAFVKVYLQSLSEALTEQTTADESDWVFSQIFACYQRMFGLRHKEGNAELELFAPLLSDGKVWQQEIASAPVTSVFGFHSGLLLKCCPASLSGLALNMLNSLDLLGDEEVYWQRQMPGLFALIESVGPAQARDAFHTWQLQGTDALPLGVGALWHGFLSRCAQVMQQINYGAFLVKNSTELAGCISVYAPEVFADGRGEKPTSLLLDNLVARIGMTLMSEPPTLAAINITRLLLWSHTKGLALSKQVWRKFWLTVEAVTDRLCHPAGRQAGAWWTLQLMACCDEMVLLEPAAFSIFAAQDLVLAETQSEELRWRAVLSGLMATACMPDYAPIDGKASVGRLFLSCDAFLQESPASWAQRSQALISWIATGPSQLFKSRLAERCAQIGAQLYDRTRLQELPSISANLRYCVLMSGLPSARMVWRNQLLARYVDERKSFLSAEDAFISNQLRESPPDALRSNLTRTALSAAIRYRSPDRVERRKLLGNETMVLGDGLRCRLTLAVRSQAAFDFMDRCEVVSSLREALTFTIEPTARQELRNVLGLWTLGAAEVLKSAGLSVENFRSDMGNIYAGSLVHDLKNDPKALVPVVPLNNPHQAGHALLAGLQVKDTARLYLAATLWSIWQRPTGLSAALFLREEVLSLEWANIQPSLSAYVMTAQSQLMAENAHLPSDDLKGWGASTDKAKQPASR